MQHSSSRRAAPRRGGRKPRVTCVDKANVIPSLAYFRTMFLEAAKKISGDRSDCVYVDATALRLVRSPWEFDVLVTENMFGDILSDLGAGLIGGMGMAPSADIGDSHAIFQPCHGTAPDIAGKGLANPTAMLLSAAMMLDWLGDRHGNASLKRGRQGSDRGGGSGLRARRPGVGGIRRQGRHRRDRRPRHRGAGCRKVPA